MKFVAKVKCQYKATIVKAGEVIDVSTIVKCPLCDGKGCPKCRQTGRIDPPHHFEPLEKPEKPVEYVDEKKDDEPSEVEQIEAIRQLFDEKGVAYDRRWKLQRLLDEKVKAEKEGKL